VEKAGWNTHSTLRKRTLQKTYSINSYILTRDITYTYNGVVVEVGEGQNPLRIYV